MIFREHFYGKMKSAYPSSNVYNIVNMFDPTLKGLVFGPFCNGII